MLHSEVIFKSVTGPDDTGQVDLQFLCTLPAKQFPGIHAGLPSPHYAVTCKVRPKYPFPQ